MLRPFVQSLCAGIAVGCALIFGSGQAHADTQQEMSTCSYVVQSGDDLSAIAERYNTTWQVLYTENRATIGANPNLIFPGQTLTLCGVSTMAAPIPAVASPVPSDSVTGMIVQVFGPYAPQALAVARCESGYNPSAWNPTPVWDGEHAQGVFQIIPSTYARSGEGGSVWNAWDNVNAAYRIFARDGYRWSEWACQP